MKNKLSFLLFLSAFSLLSCNKEELTGGPVTATGVLERQGATTYQYGSHTLRTGSTYYALTSSRVGLDPFIGRTVTITGRKVDGYPVSGGPDLIDVETVD